MRYRLLVLLLAGTLLCCAQTSKLMPLHHITSDEVRSMLNNVGVTVNSAPNNSVVLAGSESNVNAAEAIIKQADAARKPVPDVDFTVYMVTASPKEPSGKSVPPELEPVVKQLRPVFPYKSYTLMESAFLRVGGDDGLGSTEGFLPVHNPSNLPANYTITINRLKVSSDDIEPSVNIRQFRLDLNIPISMSPGNDQNGKPVISTQNRTVHLQTNIDMKVGQKIVVGKSNIDGSDDALIVVLTAKLEN